MPSQATHEVAPTPGNTLGGQRGPGHWVANKPGPREDMAGIARPNLPSGGRSWWRTSRPEGKPTGRCTTHLPSSTTWAVSGTWWRGGRQTVGARGVCESALKLPHRRAGLRSDKWRAEPRSEPDSGNPTVRDRRAALRNVTSTMRYVLVRALNFEPDNRMHGSTGGGWKRNAPASPRQSPTQPTSDANAIVVGHGIRFYSSFGRCSACLGHGLGSNGRGGTGVAPLPCLGHGRTSTWRQGGAGAASPQHPAQLGKKASALAA